MHILDRLTYCQKNIAWMHCKSLWIKASAKCINVNVIMYVFSICSPCSPYSLVSAAIQKDSLQWFLHSCKELALLLCAKRQLSINRNGNFVLFLCARPGVCKWQERADGELPYDQDTEMTVAGWCVCCSQVRHVQLCGVEFKFISESNLSSISVGTGSVDLQRWEIWTIFSFS